MDSATFNKFRRIIYDKSGINLGPGKEALVSARIGKRMRVLNINEHKDYLQYVVNDTVGQEIVHLIDAISTNVTSFFREPAHFDFVQNMLATWMSEGQRRFRLWSAASSTGEEPYSLAITLMETLESGCDARILATDISTTVLQRCIEGVYAAEKLKNISRGLVDQYFSPCRGDDGQAYSVKPCLRRLTVFQRLNLSETPYPMRGPIDIVLCRNVMIYFDNEVRSRLLAEIYRLLKPGGYLIVGHAESLTGMMSKLKTVQPSIYVKD